MLVDYLSEGTSVPFVYKCKQYHGTIVERGTYESKVLAEIDGTMQTLILPNTSLCVVQC